MCIPLSDQLLGQTGQLHHLATKQEIPLYLSLLALHNMTQTVTLVQCIGVLTTKLVLVVVEGTCNVSS